MSAPLSKQWPLTFSGSHKSDVRTQFAALCYRFKSKKPQVLLISSRGTGRWIVPKGWPISGQTPVEAVQTEAWEEAGVKGEVEDRPIGIFSYMKEYEDTPDLPCVAMVYALKVLSSTGDYPEEGERKRKWMSRKKAAGLVDSPELARIIKEFDPRAIR